MISDSKQDASYSWSDSDSGAEALDAFEDANLPSQVEREHARKVADFKKLEIRRIDTMKRKEVKQLIRADSWRDEDKREDVKRRIDHNEEITNAAVRQSQWKAKATVKKSAKELESAHVVLTTFSDTVQNINNTANEKLQEITEREARIKRESNAPKFMNRRKQPRKRQGLFG